jgi:hypothetical protein
MPRILLLVCFFALSFGSLAQISTPEKRKFNVGLYAGLSVLKYKPMVALDLSYKGTNLRIMPNYKFNSVGITQEIAKLSTTFYNLMWTASVYGGIGKDSVIFSALPANSYKRTNINIIGATGLKTYFSTRMYTHIMGGIIYSKSNPVGLEDDRMWNPYFEFGLGVHFYKNYPQLKREETEE